MKRLFYVRTATLTLFEAYPDDPKEGWMPKRECRGGQEMVYPGKYDSLDRLLAFISPNDKYLSIDHWAVSNIEDGRFLMTTDVLVDYNKREPSPDRLKAWKQGKAQLYHGYYSIEVRVQNIEDVPEQEIKKILGVKD